MIDLGISNSSPLINLERIERLDLLQNLFKELIVPEAVALEVGNVPSWIRIEAEKTAMPTIVFPPEIHFGEAAVITAGFHFAGSILVLDDWHAREFAIRHAFKIIGTVGLLLQAKEQSLISAVAPLLGDLLSVGFRVSPSLKNKALQIAGEI